MESGTGLPPASTLGERASVGQGALSPREGSWAERWGTLQAKAGFQGLQSPLPFVNTGSTPTRFPGTYGFPREALP